MTLLDSTIATRPKTWTNTYAKLYKMRADLGDKCDEVFGAIDLTHDIIVMLEGGVPKVFLDYPSYHLWIKARFGGGIVRDSKYYELEKEFYRKACSKY